MQRVEGRVAVVTGAACGIGLGIARAFADAGMKVVLADVRREPLEQAVAGIRRGGAEAIGVPTDVTGSTRWKPWRPPRSTSSAPCTFCATTPVSASSGASRRRRSTSGAGFSTSTCGVRSTGSRRSSRSSRVRTRATSTRPRRWPGCSPCLGSVPTTSPRHGVVALMATLQRELRAAHSPGARLGALPRRSEHRHHPQQRGEPPGSRWSVRIRRISSARSTAAQNPMTSVGWCSTPSETTASGSSPHRARRRRAAPGRGDGRRSGAQPAAPRLTPRRAEGRRLAPPRGSTRQMCADPVRCRGSHEAANHH